MYSDILQNIKNMLGMNLTSYETLIASAITEATEELYIKYPNVDPYTIRIATSQVSVGAAEVIVYGVQKQ